MSKAKERNLHSMLNIYTVTHADLIEKKYKTDYYALYASNLKSFKLIYLCNIKLFVHNSQMSNLS